MPQAEVPKSTEKQTSHFCEAQGCLSMHLPSDISVMGNAEILAWISNLKIETCSRKQKYFILNHCMITLLIILDPSHVDKHNFQHRKLSTNKHH